jgi:DEAD/DEAH box helicase domain-containing protein
MSDKIVLDLETKKTFDEVGGHHNSHLLEVSVCGVYSYARDEYRGFKEHEFAEMLEWLKAADLIIGFNSKHFDFTVLQPYYPNFNLGQLPHLDILEEITNVLGRRLKLESVAQETLGYGKSGDGLDAHRARMNIHHRQRLPINDCCDDLLLRQRFFLFLNLKQFYRSSSLILIS